MDVDKDLTEATGTPPLTVEHNADGGELPPFRMMIATPFGGLAEPEYVRSMWELRDWLGSHKIRGYGEEQYSRYELEAGSCLVQNRTLLVLKALQTDATHILFIDSDMNFTPHAVRLMASRHLPVVACNYVKRSLPIEFVAKDVDGVELRNPEGKIQEAGRTGLGMALISTEVFKAMPQPWFLMPWDSGFMGEDYYFFKKARECGFPLWIDNEASTQIQHIGRLAYDARMARPVGASLNPGELQKQEA